MTGKKVYTLTLDEGTLRALLLCNDIERCQQGGLDDGCGMPAEYVHKDGGHLVCRSCKEGWYLIDAADSPEGDWRDIKEGKPGFEDAVRREYAEQIASGLVEKDGKHWYKRHPASDYEPSDGNLPLTRVLFDWRMKHPKVFARLMKKEGHR